MVGFRCWRGMHEGVDRLQIVDGITSFSVTASRGDVMIIDIRWGRGTSGRDDAEQTWQSKYSIDLCSNTCRYIAKWSVKALQPETR